MHESSSKDGWMDVMQIYVRFNSISVISGQWKIDNERLCAVELHLWLRRFCLERGSNLVRWISRPALNPLSYWGSSSSTVTCAWVQISVQGIPDYYGLNGVVLQSLLLPGVGVQLSSLNPFLLVWSTKKKQAQVEKHQAKKGQTEGTHVH